METTVVVPRQYSSSTSLSFSLEFPLPSSARPPHHFRHFFRLKTCYISLLKYLCIVRAGRIFRCRRIRLIPIFFHPCSFLIRRSMSSRVKTGALCLLHSNQRECVYFFFLLFLLRLLLLYLHRGQFFFSAPPIFSLYVNV